jgi:hypothetical protein
LPPAITCVTTCPSSSLDTTVNTVDPMMLFSGTPVTLGDSIRGGSLTFSTVMLRVTEVVWGPGIFTPSSTRFTYKGEGRVLGVDWQGIRFGREHKGAAGNVTGVRGVPSTDRHRNSAANSLGCYA